MQRQITFECPDCEKEFHTSDYYVDDYAKEVCPSCWDDRQVATRGDDVEKMVKKKQQQRKPISWGAVAFYFSSLLLVLAFLFAFLSRSQHRDQQFTGEMTGAKLWLENEELREKIEWQRRRLVQYEARWKGVQEYVVSICSIPSKFDHHFDFGYAGCRIAKKGEKWDLMTRDLSDQILPFTCRVREGDPREFLLPKERARLYRDSNSCLLREVHVFENKQGTMRHSLSAFVAKVSWQTVLKKRFRP